MFDQERVPHAAGIEAPYRHRAQPVIQCIGHDMNLSSIAWISSDCGVRGNSQFASLSLG